MLIALCILLLTIIGIYVFMRSARFGKAPSGQRLQRMQSSQHYRSGQFQNLSHTPALIEGASYSSVMWKFFFGKEQGNKPAGALPSKKTDLHNLNPVEDVLVWFGHSSYFLQVNGKKFLVDPVFSGAASPVPATTRSFKGSDVYTADDMPFIDYLILTHDHYDHLDYGTVQQLKPKVTRVVAALGVGAHLERWGYSAAQITELDWDEELLLDNDIKFIAATARHFSGRNFRRNSTLWLSLILITPKHKLYLGGDSGYDAHFKAIGAQYGPFDIAILESGQYNIYWKYIHMLPEETIQAAIDLKAKMLMPVHWGKFALALHPWNEPIKKVLEAATGKPLDIVHPMIGEVAYLNKKQVFQQWWADVK